MSEFTMYGTFLGASTDSLSDQDKAYRAAVAAALELRSPLATAFTARFWSQLIGQQFIANLTAYADQRAHLRPLGMGAAAHFASVITNEAEAATIDCLVKLRDHPALRDPRENLSWPHRLDFDNWRCFVHAVYAAIIMADDNDEQSFVWREAKKVLDGNIAVLALTYPDDDFTPTEVHGEWHVIIRMTAENYRKAIDPTAALLG